MEQIIVVEKVENFEKKLYFNQSLIMCSEVAKKYVHIFQSIFYLQLNTCKKIFIFIQKYRNTFKYWLQIVSFTDRPCDSLFTTLSQKGDFVSSFSHVFMTLESVKND